MRFALFIEQVIRRLGTGVNPNMASAVVHKGILTTMGVIDASALKQDLTLQQQTNNILGQIDGLLKEGGTDRTKLLTANIWLKDIGRDFAPFNNEWQKWIDAENKPIRACVEANLAFPQLLIEIQVTAAVDE
jgi:enamine deaminase RidA (YjgF/YER057c/UK114 family)